eukprot:1895303-Lingulodinium_polyedra.AAC.1
MMRSARQPGATTTTRPLTCGGRTIGGMQSPCSRGQTPYRPGCRQPLRLRRACASTLLSTLGP